MYFHSIRRLINRVSSTGKQSRRQVERKRPTSFKPRLEAFEERTLLSGLQVFGTGVDNTGTLLPVGAVDPHWQLIRSADPSLPGPNTFVQSGNIFPIANGPTSQWLGSNNPGNAPPGTYLFETIVNFTGSDPSTAKLSGQLATSGPASIFLNGNPIGINSPGPGAFTPFVISGLSGANKVDVSVQHLGGPIGIRTNLNGSAMFLTTTTVTTSATATIVYGQQVTYTATVAAVAPFTGTPTGNVKFLADGSNIGTATLANGVATVTTNQLSTGPHTIVASYIGDTAFTTSSGTCGQVVNKDDATTTVAAATPNPSTSGQSVTFTVTVTAAAPGSGTPSGTVQLADNGSNLGAVSLANGGGTFTTSQLLIGSNTITAAYNGDTNFNGSTSNSVTRLVTAVIALTPSTLSDGTVGASYSQPITASGGIGPYSFAVTAGTLFQGLALSSAGVLSGSPTTAGTSTFTVTATDANGNMGSKQYTIAISPAPNPTVTYWTGLGKNTNWDDSGNWNNGLPGPQRAAIFDDTHAVTFESKVGPGFGTVNGLISTWHGTIDVLGSLPISTRFNVAAGTIVGGDITLNPTSLNQLTGGTIVSTTLRNSGVTNFSGEPLFRSVSLDNLGTITFDGASRIHVEWQGESRIFNDGKILISPTTGEVSWHSAGDSTLKNNGVLDDYSPGYVNIGMPVINTVNGKIKAEFGSNLHLMMPVTDAGQLQLFPQSMTTFADFYTQLPGGVFTAQGSQLLFPRGCTFGGDFSATNCYLNAGVCTNKGTFECDECFMDFEVCHNDDKWGCALSTLHCGVLTNDGQEACNHCNVNIDVCTNDGQMAFNDCNVHFGFCTSEGGTMTISGGVCTIQNEWTAENSTIQVTNERLTCHDAQFSHCTTSINSGADCEIVTEYTETDCQTIVAPSAKLYCFKLRVNDDSFRDNGTVNATGDCTVAGSNLTVSGIFNSGATLTATHNSRLVVAPGGKAYCVLVRIEDDASFIDDGMVNATVTNDGGILSGKGVVKGSVFNKRIFNPIGLSIDGDLKLDPKSILNIAISNALVPNLTVTGAAGLNGTLHVFLSNGYQPPPFTQVEIIKWGSYTGNFDHVFEDSPMDFQLRISGAFCGL